MARIGTSRELYIYVYLSVLQIAQLARESSYGVLTSGPLNIASSSHIDGELWHNFLKQETNTQLLPSTQESR